MVDVVDHIAKGFCILLTTLPSEIVDLHFVDYRFIDHYFLFC